MQNSILAGELLSLLENVSAPIRIVDIETILQATKKDIDLTVTRLLSEGLVEIIKKDERIAITLTKKVKAHKNNYLENNLLKPVLK